MLTKVIVVLSVLTIVGLLVVAFALGARDASDWSRFVVENDCVLVRHGSGHLGVTSDGKTMYFAGKDIWRCADGVEYER